MSTAPAPSPPHPHRHSPSGGSSHYLWPVAWTVLAIAAISTLLVKNETAREVAFGTFTTLFGIFATPFILETTVGLVGIFIVLAINRWRLHREGDGWVYMVTHEPDPGSSPLPEAITQRLHAILPHRPEITDEADAARMIVEGFLEMGMAAQARQEVQEWTGMPDDASTRLLRVRVHAANLDTHNAQALLRESLSRSTNSGEAQLHHQTAQDCARWLEAHAPQQKAAVQLWHAQAAEIGG